MLKKIDDWWIFIPLYHPTPMKQLMQQNAEGMMYEVDFFKYKHEWSKIAVQNSWQS